MNNPDLVPAFEERVAADLTSYLQHSGRLDARVPECPDVEECWPVVGNAYLADGVREYEQYPTVSLGWMMFLGMAMAFYWDTDWASYAGHNDYYETLREARGYDNLDETILDLLEYVGDDAERLSKLVADCASRVNSQLRHADVEPGTPQAFACYVSALHQLYLAGMRIELNALGYHMSPMGS